MARVNKNAIYNKLLQSEIDKKYAEQRQSGIVRAGEIESVLVGLRTAMELFKACLPDATVAPEVGLTAVPGLLPGQQELFKKTS